jgi:hypothetical protein
LAIVVSAGAIAVAIPGLSGARPTTAKSQTLRIYDKPSAITLTTAGGRVISHPPYPQPGVGDTLDVYSVDYPGNHRHHSSRWTMSNHLRCTFGQGQPVCVSDLAVNNSLLVFNGNKLIGATGTYRGATGRVVSMKQLAGDTSDIVLRIQH